MARPQRVSDDDIAVATIRALRTFGPGVSVLQIAELLMVSPPALFRRHGSKAGLMRNALRVLASQQTWREPLAVPANPQDWHGQLEAIAQAAMQAFDNAIVAVEAMRAAGGLIDPADLAREYGFPSPPEIHALLATWLADAGITDAALRASVLLGGVQFELLRYRTERGGPDAAGPDVAGIVAFAVRDLAGQDGHQNRPRRRTPYVRGTPAP